MAQTLSQYTKPIIISGEAYGQVQQLLYELEREEPDVVTISEDPIFMEKLVSTQFSVTLDCGRCVYLNTSVDVNSFGIQALVLNKRKPNECDHPIEQCVTQRHDEGFLEKFVHPQKHLSMGVQPVLLEGPFAVDIPFFSGVLKTAALSSGNEQVIVRGAVVFTPVRSGQYMLGVPGMKDSDGTVGSTVVPFGAWDESMTRMDLFQELVAAFSAEVPSNVDRYACRNEALHENLADLVLHFRANRNAWNTWMLTHHRVCPACTAFPKLIAKRAAKAVTPSISSVGIPQFKVAGGYTAGPAAPIVHHSVASNTSNPQQALNYIMQQMGLNVSPAASISDADAAQAIKTGKLPKAPRPGSGSTAVLPDSAYADIGLEDVKARRGGATAASYPNQAPSWQARKK